MYVNINKDFRNNTNCVKLERTDYAELSLEKYNSLCTATSKNS